MIYHTHKSVSYHLNLMAFTYLNPIIIRISNKSNSVDTTLGWLFVKLDAQRFKSLTGLFKIIDKHRSVTKSSTHIVLVAIVVSKIRLIFSTPIAFMDG